jgi:hypothetical protein
VVEGDGNTTRLLFWCAVDFVDGLNASAISSALVHIKGVEDAGGKSRLAVVNVADGAYVHVRLCTIEFCHTVNLSYKSPTRVGTNSRLVSKKIADKPKSDAKMRYRQMYRRVKESARVLQTSLIKTPRQRSCRGVFLF